MQGEYIVTIMKKTNINENSCIYSVDTIAMGNIDEKTQILTSDDGQTYKCINDFSDFENTTECYSNKIKVSEITNVFKDSASFYDALQEYEKRCRQELIYIEKTNDNYMLLIIDKNKYIQEMENVKTKKKTEPDFIEELDNRVEENIYDLKDVVINILSKDYSADELSYVKHRLTEEK